RPVRGPAGVHRGVPRLVRTRGPRGPARQGIRRLRAADGPLAAALSRGPGGCALARPQPGDTEVGPGEDVQALDLELATELAEGAVDHAAMDGADDLRVRLREVVKRAAAHVDLTPVRFGLEALRVEQPDDLDGHLVLARPDVRRRAVHQVATPGGACRLRALARVAELGDSPG